MYSHNLQRNGRVMMAPDVRARSSSPHGRLVPSSTVFLSDLLCA